ncbi:MAG: glutamate-5-semialdehyde dehydrogenase [Planctomycetota bacterium]|nr:glutamate-5-semialdehyde dehydrogenase [Planctomycetaceae bacterium]MDQ3330010.1 glutamate-5-semialdehyde dehydrogenase [Planctomycetota bacterium]
MSDLAKYAHKTASNARVAARRLAGANSALKNEWLRKSAAAIRRNTRQLAAANRADLDAAPGYGLSTAAIDRLRLTDQRLEALAASLEEIVTLFDPVGEVIEGYVRPNGLRVTKTRVPLGVVFFIYESRPNVTVDAAAICVKSGNAVVLRGGKEAFHSNAALHAVLVESLVECGLPADAVQFVSTTDRNAVGEFLALGDLIDVTIPRGGKGLIERVAAEAKMPVIKHLDGVCHVFVDETADLDMARRIVLNSKAQRPGVCNALETLLVHARIADRFLPAVASDLGAAKVEIRGCSRTRELIRAAVPATEDDWPTEYLDLILSVKVVEHLDEAIRHIETYGSHHTDAIVTSDVRSAARFTSEVDSAAVIVNASTRFNDGGELGLGAEIGISTDKFHARGPCGLREMTSYKWIVHGDGQTRV